MPQSYAVAKIWYEKAAASGFEFAMVRLGNIYENGLGVPKNAKAAREWYQKAARLRIHQWPETGWTS